MKAAIIDTHKSQLTIKIFPIPVLKGHEILVRIHACGCCHTNLHIMNDDWLIKCKLPLCLGHEGVGVVHSVGSEINNIKVGDRVGIPWLNSACGICEFCLTGWETLCKSQSFTGFNVDGCLREYAVAHGKYAIKLPPDLAFEQAAPLMCAGLTSYKGIKETETKAGNFLCIVGAAGGLGHLAVQYGKAMGLRVIAVDLGQDRIDYCKSLGAEFGVDIANPTPSTSTTSQGHTLTAAAAVQEYIEGGAHGVLVLATQASAFKAAVDMCRPRGTVVCVGLPSGSFDCPILDVVLRRITIRGSLVGTRQDMAEALDFAARGLVTCSVQTYPLEAVNEVYERLKSGSVVGRIVIKMV